MSALASRGIRVRVRLALKVGKVRREPILGQALPGAQDRRHDGADQGPERSPTVE